VDVTWDAEHRDAAPSVSSRLLEGAVRDWRVAVDLHGNPRSDKPSVGALERTG